MMIKWTKHITSWHTFHSPFKILIYYKYNNVRASISRSNKHIPDDSQLPRQAEAQAREAGKPQVGALLTCQAAPQVFLTHRVLPPNSQCASCLPSSGLCSKPPPRDPACLLEAAAAPAPTDTCWVRSTMCFVYPFVVSLLELHEDHQQNHFCTVLFPTPARSTKRCQVFSVCLILLSMPQKQ